MLKAHENPPLLYPEEISITDFTGHWLVAHTKSRNEKALAHDLMARGVQYFLPMTWSVSKRARRTTKSLLPLFAGYVFVCGDEENRLDILKTNRVANIIEVTDQGFFLSELAQIDQALRTGAPLTPHNYLEKGQWCRVISGPLMGLEGMVQEMRTITRLILQINLLGQAAAVEIDRDMIETIEKPPQAKEG